MADQPKFHITSHNQQGGITAGQVFMGTPARHVDQSFRIHLLEKVKPYQGKTISVGAVMGDAEAFAFAHEIKEVLVQNGFRVDGVSHVVVPNPIKGQIFNEHGETPSITVGTNN